MEHNSAFVHKQTNSPSLGCDEDNEEEINRAVAATLVAGSREALMEDERQAM